MIDNSEIVLKLLSWGEARDISIKIKRIRSIGAAYKDEGTGFTVADVDLIDSIRNLTVRVDGRKDGSSLFKDLDENPSFIRVTVNGNTERFNLRHIFPLSVGPCLNTGDSSKRTLTKFQIFPKRVPGYTQVEHPIVVSESKYFIAEAVALFHLDDAKKIQLRIMTKKNPWDFYEQTFAIDSILSIADERTYDNNNNRVSWSAATLNIKGKSHPLHILTYASGRRIEKYDLREEAKAKASPLPFQPYIVPAKLIQPDHPANTSKALDQKQVVSEKTPSEIKLMVPYGNNGWECVLKSLELSSVESITGETPIKEKTVDGEGTYKWRTAIAKIKREKQPLTILTFRERADQRGRMCASQEYDLPPVLKERLKPQRPSTQEITSGKTAKEYRPGQQSA